MKGSDVEVDDDFDTVFLCMDDNSLVMEGLPTFKKVSVAALSHTSSLEF